MIRAGAPALRKPADLRKADGLKHYVDWAAKQGFGVIDVNVPKNLVGPGVCVSFCSGMDAFTHDHEAKPRRSWNQSN